MEVRDKMVAGMRMGVLIDVGGAQSLPIRQHVSQRP